jgi:4a-hydroxytetrahydrobiopterin dehydratase
MRKVLTDAEIERELRTLPGWELRGKEIRRWFERGSFRNAVAFVNAVAEIAERADHHPDIDIRYDKVLLALTTWDSGGLTARDFTVAREISALASQPGAR